VTVRVGELGTSMAVAVVRPVRSDGEAISAGGRRLGRLAGPTVAERLQGLGDLPVGGAVITPAGDLPAEFIIHAVLQSAEEQVSTNTVRRALMNALRRARDLGLESLSIPLLGTGAGNLEAEEAARLLVDALKEHFGQGEDPGSVEILVDNAYQEELFARLIAAQGFASAGDAR
jgi:O-acetyl-ADP-ribose deacetylase (regulator of RNase III)